MNELRIFDNEEFGKVRVVEIDGDGWFCGSDIAKALGYAKPQNAIDMHVDEDDSLKRGIIDSLGRTQQTTCINESGLYSLVLSSKLPTAKKFKRWITSEVLPSIRKHGAYLTPDTLEKTITDPDFLIGLLTNLKEEQKARRLAEAKIEEQKPLVQFAETVSDSKDNMDMGNMAKLCAKEGYKVGRNRLFELLREQKILMDNNVPYQKYIDNGWFKVVEVVKASQYGSKLFVKTLVTGKGQIKIVELIKLNEENTI